MFLHALPQNDRETFVRAAWALIHCDKDVDPREESLLAELHAEMGGIQPIDDVAPDEVISELRDVDGELVGRVILLELAGVAMADEVLHESERDFLVRAAHALGIETDRVDRYVDFADRARGIWVEGRSLILD